MRFKEKVAIVAGAGQGIGEGIAVALAAEGAQVMVWDINKDTAQEIVKKIQTAKGNATAVKMDALNYDQVKAGVDQVIKEFGRLDIMVCTVGGGKMKEFKDPDSADFIKKQVEFNLYPVVNCAHAAYAPMLEKNSGGMLFFSSATGGIPAMAGYQMGKAAIESMVKTMVAELENKKSRVSINVISPGVTETPLTVNHFLSMPGGEKIWEIQKGRRPHGVQTSADVAKLALFLLSDDAQRVTGQVLTSSL